MLRLLLLVFSAVLPVLPVPSVAQPVPIRALAVEAYDSFHALRTKADLEAARERVLFLTQSYERARRSLRMTTEAVRASVRRAYPVPDDLLDQLFWGPHGLAARDPSRHGSRKPGSRETLRSPAAARAEIRRALRAELAEFGDPGALPAPPPPGSSHRPIPPPADGSARVQRFASPYLERALASVEHMGSTDGYRGPWDGRWIGGRWIHYSSHREAGRAAGAAFEWLKQQLLHRHPLLRRGQGRVGHPFHRLYCAAMRGRPARTSGRDVYPGECEPWRQRSRPTLYEWLLVFKRERGEACRNVDACPASPRGLALLETLSPDDHQRCLAQAGAMPVHAAPAGAPPPSGPPSGYPAYLLPRCPEIIHEHLEAQRAFPAPDRWAGARADGRSAFLDGSADAPAYLLHLGSNPRMLQRLDQGLATVAQHEERLAAAVGALRATQDPAAACVADIVERCAYVAPLCDEGDLACDAWIGPGFLQRIARDRASGRHVRPPACVLAAVGGRPLSACVLR